MNKTPPSSRLALAVSGCLLALVLTAVSLLCTGCFAGDGRLEEEFSKGYAAGEAAARAELVGDEESLVGEEAQGVLAAIGEGRAANFVLKEYTIEGDTCRAYGTMALNDGSTLYVSLLLEKNDGVWRVSALGQATPGEGL
ncbi:MAG: hypothetical protein AB1384_07950 [Actinomycetota bacterium]